MIAVYKVVTRSLGMLLWSHGGQRSWAGPLWVPLLSNTSQHQDGWQLLPWGMDHM